MVKIITNNIAKIKNKIIHFYYCIINIPNLYENKIVQFKNYYNDCKYKVTHLKNTNYDLGVEHLYHGNLNDALLRFGILNKFSANKNSTEYLDTHYWLGWTYFLKNNCVKALEHIKKSSAQNKQQIVTFMQNYKNIQEIPQEIWQRYRDLIAQYYPEIFQNSNNINLPYSFVHQTIKHISNLPDSYSILELGSNVGFIGHETKKRFSDSFTLMGVESSVIMTNLIKIYYPNNKIYNQLYNISILEFLQQTKEKFDIILSFCSLSFTSSLETYFRAVYSILNKDGYFTFCLPIGSNTKFVLKRKEFIFNLNQIHETLNKIHFNILSSEQLVLAENNQYCIIVCKKINHKK